MKKSNDKDPSKMTIEELQLEYDEKSKLYEELKPIVDQYYAASHRMEYLGEQLQRIKKRSTLSLITKKTNFVECSYPSMGVSGSNGSAVFEDEESAKQLVASLASTSSYYYAYELKWTGPGSYIAKSSYKTDHDGDTVYTCTFNRGEPQPDPESLDSEED